MKIKIRDAIYLVWLGFLLAVISADLGYGIYNSNAGLSAMASAVLVILLVYIVFIVITAGKRK